MWDLALQSTSSWWFVYRLVRVCEQASLLPARSEKFSHYLRVEAEQFEACGTVELFRECNLHFTLGFALRCGSTIPH